MDNIFFDNTDSLWRIVITAPLLYATVVGFIRVSGKRSTSQMNNFDWVVTVAMGSLVASGIISKDVKIVEVILAIALLLALQYMITWGVTRLKWLETIVKAEPRLLVRDGEFLKDAMHKERVTRSEIMAAVRENGIRHINEIDAVILETDASMSVIAKSKDDSAPLGTIEHVMGVHNVD